jgi:hypothetical protein
MGRVFDYKIKRRLLLNGGWKYEEEQPIPVTGSGWSWMQVSFLQSRV